MADELPVDPEADEQATEEETSPEALDETGDDTPSDEPTSGESETAEPEEEAVDDELLSEEEITNLKGDPDKLVRAMQRAFTQKTQKLAAQKQFFQALQSDPKAVINYLAAKAGMKVTEAEKEAGAPGLREQLAEVLGDEAATKLLPLLQQIVKQQTEPVEHAQRMMLAETAAAETQSTLEAFSAKYPDWRKYEKKMVEIGSTLRPAPGSNMTDFQYMESLLRLARTGESDAQTTKRVVDRINGSARAAESPTPGVPTKRVSMKAPGKVTFDQAWDAATKGIRFEH